MSIWNYSAQDTRKGPKTIWHIKNYPKDLTKGFLRLSFQLNQFGKQWTIHRKGLDQGFHSSVNSTKLILQTMDYPQELIKGYLRLPIQLNQLDKQWNIQRTWSRASLLCFFLSKPILLIKLTGLTHLFHRFQNSRDPVPRSTFHSDEWHVYEGSCLQQITQSRAQTQQGLVISHSTDETPVQLETLNIVAT